MNAAIDSLFFVRLFSLMGVSLVNGDIQVAIDKVRGVMKGGTVLVRR